MPLEYPEVQETNERMVFLVRSDRNPAIQYRVDCLANSGAGGCSCPNFHSRKYPNQKKGMKAWTEDTMCKHQIRAAWHVIRLTFKDMSRAEDYPRR